MEVEELEFVSEYSDDDEKFVFQHERIKSLGRRLSKKGSIITDDAGKRKSSIDRKSSFDRKPAKKTKRKLKTVAKLSVGIKNRMKKTKDKKLAKRGSRDVWERVDVTENEASSAEDVTREDAPPPRPHPPEGGASVSSQSLSKVNRGWKTARHAVDCAVNPKQRSGESKPLKQPGKKKTMAKPSGGSGDGKKKINHDDNDVLEIGNRGDDVTLVSPIDNDDDDDDDMGTDLEQERESQSGKHGDQMRKWRDDPHHVESSYSDDFTDDDASVASSLNTNDNDTYQPSRTSANARYYLQHSGQRRRSGREGVGGDEGDDAKRALKDGRAAEGLYSAEMRRQRVLGMYGTGYALRWAVSPKGRAGLITPDREALSALRRNLPPTPEETIARTRESNKKAEPSNDENEKLQAEIDETAQGTINGNVLSNLCLSQWCTPLSLVNS